MTDQLKNKTTACPSTGGDWFLPAIESRGNVTDCLNEVLTELNERRSFIVSIKSRMSTSGINIDCISSIAQKAKALENTLKVRLGMLNPEREASWFRVSSSHNAGPFAPTLLSEAVFFNYERSEVQSIKRTIVKCWENHEVFPSSAKGQCLWSMLLSLNNQLEHLTSLPSPFEEYRLDKLPDGLPETLDSRSLRAFLTNVRNEIYSIQRRLDNCYQQLFQSSEKFWVFQTKMITRDRASRIKNQAADDMREKFKERRQKARSSATQMKISLYQESLRFMGFATLPTGSNLKKRYIDLAKKHHPDRQGGDEEKFKQLTRAYVHLTDRL